MLLLDSTGEVTLRSMFPPVEIICGGLKIREFGPQDTVQVAAFVAAGDHGSAAGLPRGRR
jgi:hypothetical protein